MNFRRDQRRYRVYLEDGANSNQVDAWRYMELRGDCGQIYPYSKDFLGVQITGTKTAAKIRRKRQYEILQDADDMVVFKVPNQELGVFAELLQSRKKPQYSPEVLEMKRKAIQKARQNLGKA